MAFRLSTKPRVLIGLGSNKGDRLANLRAGVRFLLDSGAIEEVAASSLYASEPVECEGGEFYNAVVMANSSFAPDGLLAVAAEAEVTAGRTGHGGDERPLDVDIIYHGDAIVKAPCLTLPHPGRMGRAFVLVPLGEVCGDAVDPETGRPVRVEVAERAGRTGPKLRRVSGPEWMEDADQGVANV